MSNYILNFPKFGWGLDDNVVSIFPRPGHKAPPAPPPACPTQYRLKTPAEAGTDDPVLVRYGGQIGKHPQTQTDLMGVTVLYLIVGNDVVCVEPQWVETTQAHDFPDTGCQRSWCKRCNAEGRFDWRSGKFSA